MTNEATTPSGQPLGISHKPSKSVAMFTKFKAVNKMQRLAPNERP